MKAREHSSFFLKYRFRIGILPVAAALFLGACSSGSSSNPPASATRPANDDPSLDRPGLMVTGLNGRSPDDTSTFWLAVVGLFRAESVTPGSGDAFVDLLRFRGALTMQSYVDFYTPALDTCEIRELDVLVGGTGDSGGFSPSVSGGPTVTINSQGGTLVELPQVGDNPGFYEVDDLLPGPLPSGATLSVPGDDFPNVSAYPLYEPSAPVRISPADRERPLTLDDVLSPFTWEASPNVPGGFFQIAALAFREDGSFAGFPVVCDVVDDGEFSMPPEVIEYAMTTPFTVEARFERVIQRLDLVNGIVFRQRSTVSE